jgi:hydroxyethylthiazole kinase
MRITMIKADDKIIKDLLNALKNVKKEIPLTHCITNYVTINDCANAVLAIGGSPMMADDPEEVEEFVEIADTLVINIGKMSQTQIEAMIIGARHGTKTKTPITLDPVAVGVTNLRNNLVLELINEAKISTIRGNMSEIKAIARLIELDEGKLLAKSESKGVDVSKEDEISADNLKYNGKLVKALSKKLNTVIIASGTIDIISNGQTVYACENGDPLMPKITGSGCMLSSIVGTFCGVSDAFIGGIAATVVMGIAGEKAGEVVRRENAGTGTFRAKLIDYLYNLDEKTIKKKIKLYKMR